MIPQTKKYTLLLLVFCCGGFVFSAGAQGVEVKLNHPVRGKPQAVQTSILFPLGNFSDTHWGGAGISYAWSRRRFSPLKVITKKRFGFSAEGGALLFIGKNEIRNNYTYQYPIYTLLFIRGGLIYNYDRNWIAALRTGPGISFYNGLTQFNWNTSFKIQYGFRPHWNAGPQLEMLNEKKSRSLWGAGIQVSYLF